MRRGSVKKDFFFSSDNFQLNHHTAGEREGTATPPGMGLSSFLIVAQSS